MKKPLSMLSFCVVAIALFALPMQAQYDPGTDWKLNQVNDVNYLSGGCDSGMTADECFAAGSTSGAQTCQSNRCAICVGNPSSDAYHPNPSCSLSSEPGSCKCSIVAGARDCTLTGTCYYHP